MITLRARRRATIRATALTWLLVAAAAVPAVASDVATLESPGPDAAATPAPSIAPGDIEDAMLAFSRCMRDHGTDMPDPQVDGSGRVFVGRTETTSEGEDEDGASFSIIDLDDPAFQEATSACSGLLEGVRPQIDPEQRAEMQAELLAYAQCMRDHGIDMPDPEFGTGPGGGAVSIRLGGAGGADIDPGSDEFQAAQEACGGAIGFGPAARIGGGVDPGDDVATERAPSPQP